MTDAPKITKHREDNGWRIRSNGTDTNLMIQKAEAPRWGRQQEYDLIDTASDAWVFTGRGVSLIMERLEGIYAEIARGVK